MGHAKAPEQLRQIGIQQGAHEPELEPGEDAARGALRRGRRPLEAKQRFADLVIEGAARDGQRDFVLSVPRETTTAREANAWTYGLSSDQYKPEVRT
jgi:hypothetical protein